MSTPLSTEQSNILFRAYQNGDNDALDALYRHWQAYVKRRVGKVISEDVEDVAQEVWILVQKHGQKWNVDKSGWYLFLDYRIRQAVSHYISYQQAFKRQADYQNARLDDADTALEPLASNDPPVIDYLIFQERLQAVQDAIARCAFPEPVRMILDMKLSDQSYAVIAKRVGMERQAVVNAVQRAIRRIRHALDV